MVGTIKVFKSIISLHWCDRLFNGTNVVTNVVMSAEVRAFSINSDVVRPIEFFLLISTIPRNQDSVKGLENSITSDSENKCDIWLLS